MKVQDVQEWGSTMGVNDSWLFAIWVVVIIVACIAQHFFIKKRDRVYAEVADYFTRHQDFKAINLQDGSFKMVRQHFRQGNPSVASKTDKMITDETQLALVSKNDGRTQWYVEIVRVKGYKKIYFRLYIYAFMAHAPLSIKPVTIFSKTLLNLPLWGKQFDLLDALPEFQEKFYAPSGGASGKQHLPVPIQRHFLEFYDTFPLGGGLEILLTDKGFCYSTGNMKKLPSSRELAVFDTFARGLADLYQGARKQG